MESVQHKRHRSRSRSPSSRKHRKHTHRSRSRDRNHADEEDRANKHKRRSERGEEELEDRERRKEKKAKREEKEARRRDSEKEKRKGLEILDDDESADEWVEKDMNEVDIQNAVSNIPTRASLPLNSNPSIIPKGAKLPPTLATGNFEGLGQDDTKRESWMLEPTSMTIPGLLVGESGNVAKAPDHGVPHSARVNERDAREIIGNEQETRGGSRTLGKGSGALTDAYEERNSSGGDFFSDMGTARTKKVVEKPDPDKLIVSRFELNQQLKEGKSVDEYVQNEKKKTVPGSSGSQWRMMKLRKVYEQADEESRSIEEVALERYGNMEDFEEAVEERRVLDDRGSRRSARKNPTGIDTPTSNNSGFSRPDSGPSTPGALPGSKRFMFTSDEAASSRPSSRAGFRRPGEEGRFDEAIGLRRTASSNSLAGQAGGFSTPTQSLRPSGRFEQSKPATPIPSVLTPHHLLRNPLSAAAIPRASASGGTADPGLDPTSSQPPLSLAALNTLQAKVLRAKLSDDPSAQSLQEDYDRESEKYRAYSAGGGDQGGGMWEGNKNGVDGQLGRSSDSKSNIRTEVQVLPTLNARGQLYDIGTGDGTEKELLPGNRRPKLNGKFETRDSKTGEVVRYNADDDTTTLGELVRQERFAGGSGDQKSMDASMANAIAGDAKYENDNDYMDDNVERLARKKMKNDAMKRAFAVNDYSRTKKALDTCPFCYQEEGPPKAPIVAIGHRAYLSCTQNEELVDGHCIIVPIQHYTSTLDLDDDEWEEIKNFMKCLMQMFAQKNLGVIFFETVLPSSIKYHKHSYIEAIPLPANQFADAPAYFREAILASESEWSQHKKLIDFSDRPGGFRRSLISNMPYFMVHWDYKGEKGYGHVIEGEEQRSGNGLEEDVEGLIDEGEKGGGEYTRYFAHEIIGNLLGLEARRWRKPRRVDPNMNQTRKGKLGNRFQPFNWTLQLDQETSK